MLALNKALQKTGEGLDTQFIRIKYVLSGGILALCTEKANAGLLIPRQSNLLIRAASGGWSGNIGALAMTKNTWNAS